MLTTFEGRSTRFTEDGCIVAADLAMVLGYRNAPDMTRVLDEDEKGTRMVRTPGGEQAMTVVTESGLYRICLSRQAGYIKDEAARQFVKRFQRWVTSEVLPSIRKTGSYGATDVHKALNDPASLRQLLLENVEKVLALEAEVATSRPKVEVYDRIVDTGDTLGFREACKLIHAGTGANETEVRDFMLRVRWIQRLGGRLAPASYGQEKAYVTSRDRELPNVTNINGNPMVVPQLRITQRGVARAIERINERATA